MRRRRGCLFAGSGTSWRLGNAVEILVLHGKWSAKPTVNTSNRGATPSLLDRTPVSAARVFWRDFPQLWLIAAAPLARVLHVLTFSSHSRNSMRAKSGKKVFLSRTSIEVDDFHMISRFGPLFGLTSRTLTEGSS